MKTAAGAACHVSGHPSVSPGDNCLICLSTYSLERWPLERRSNTTVLLFKLGKSQVKLVTIFVCFWGQKHGDEEHNQYQLRQTHRPLAKALAMWSSGLFDPLLFGRTSTSVNTVTANHTWSHHQLSNSDAPERTFIIPSNIGTTLWKLCRNVCNRKEHADGLDGSNTDSGS